MSQEPEKTTQLHPPQLHAAVLSHPCLKLLAGEQTGLIMPISLSEFIIGRSPNCDLVLPVPGVSREHLKLLRAVDGSVKLMDLNSTNGTYVNGQRASFQQLQENDLIGLESTPLAQFVHQRPHEIDLANKLAQHQAGDPLTGVFNKRHWMDCLAREISLCQRHQLSLSVLVVAPDPTPSIRTSWQETGAPQSLLKSLAELLESLLPSEDILARLEKEQFGVLLRGKTLAEAVETAEGLRARVAATTFPANSARPRPTQVTLSAGVAEWAADVSAVELMNAAKGAYAEARNAGNTVLASGRG